MAAVMAEEWFKWERESALHSLFLPLEASVRPLREFFGRGWPTTLLVFRGDAVLWCNEMRSLHSLGAEMIDLYRDSRERDAMLAEWERREKNLFAVFEKIQAERFGKALNEEIAGLYALFRKAYLDWYAVGWLAEPVSLQCEALVRELLLRKGLEPDSKEFKTAFSLLTSTTRESFNRREEKEFLAIAARAQKNGASNASVTASLLEHGSKWFWLQNNYLETRVLGTEFFDEELKRFLKRGVDAAKYAKTLDENARELAAERRGAVEKLGLTRRERELTDLIDVFGWFQDHRKQVVLQANHFLDALLAEAGRRGGLTLREARQTLPNEFELALTGKIDKKTLRERLANCVVVWRESESEPEIFAGATAAEKNKTLFKNDSAAREVIEIRGLTACQGKARGYARVTLSAKEANASLRSGEILVTSMTSPDFVTAVKRAAGIVTNKGGITCHAAIVSREFGVPCVVGTRIATKVIKTGDFVEVDGNHGFVRKLVKEK